ncbi:MAG: SDR family NAD(P)-dependent oxidoreductase [Actinomycetia bacterium]|nr:SDR family NAD(P)-dependent oxidoreductase [Actinomycetes bacterium]
MTPIDVLDAVLEAPIVPSFTRIGFAARRGLGSWKDLDDYDLTGRVVLLTGATSGLGLAAATQLARCGADLVVVGRSEERNAAAVAQLGHDTGNDRITQIPADMGDLMQVRALAERFVGDHDRLDVLIHNAGALSGERQEAPDGTEATVASQVVGPFLLTGLLLGQLAASAPSRVLTMSSGGMYASSLTVEGLQMRPGEYSGAKQYSLAKRAQVTLNELWAEKFGDQGIHFHALHPGWADTPGVDAALPTFGKVMGPLLRTPQEGADTLVWLAADSAALDSSGLFWLDRRVRRTHRLRSTREADTVERRARLWDTVCAMAGISPSIPDAPG